MRPAAVLAALALAASRCAPATLAACDFGRAGTCVQGPDDALTPERCAARGGEFALGACATVGRLGGHCAYPDGATRAYYYPPRLATAARVDCETTARGRWIEDAP